MGGGRPLRLVPGFFGADEALTDYAPGRDEWAATLIVDRRRRARGARPCGRGGRRDGAARGSAGRAGRWTPDAERRRCPMTRLTETDVTTLTRDLEAFEARLHEATGLGLRDLALRTVTDGDRCVQLRGARVAAVPMSSGEGVIAGFSACVVATLLHLGCDAWMTTQPDVRGMQAAVAAGAQRPLSRRRLSVHRAQPHQRLQRRRRPGDGRRLRDRARRGRRRASRAARCCCWASARWAAPPCAGWRRAAPGDRRPSRTKSASTRPGTWASTF